MQEEQIQYGRKYLEQRDAESCSDGTHDDKVEQIGTEENQESAEQLYHEVHRPRYRNTVISVYLFLGKQIGEHRKADDNTAADNCSKQ